MDLGEKAFQFFSNWRQGLREQRLVEHRYLLTDCERALTLVIQTLCPEPIEIHSSRNSGFRGTQFFLPLEINAFPDRKLNRDLYLHQAMMLAGARSLGLNWSQTASTDYERAYELASHRERITQHIQERHAGFFQFQSDLTQKLKAHFQVASQNWGLPAKEVWHEFQAPLGQKVQRRHIPIKKNEYFPQVIWNMWGGLGSSSSVDPAVRFFKKNNVQRNSGSEKEIKTNFEKKEMSLEKEEQNPVTHSFEKLETADEYQGGNRTQDGSDQLQEHSNALNELNINHVTRSGEAATSFIKSDVASSEGESVLGTHEGKAEKVFLYPEWNATKKVYQIDHCRLLIQEAAVTDNGDAVRNRIYQNHMSLIEKSRQQLQRICNRRKWRSQQLEGSEIDIDAFVRHLADLRQKLPSSANVYMNQFLRARDFEVMVLVDMSLSTDSYVNNLRVLDVALDSIALMGLLSKDLADRVTVAGTFSETRHHCVFEYLKRPEEDWSLFFQRASGVVPRGYTRLGPAIRHATQLLSQSESQNRILLLLTDGKPTDFDGYEGRYGVEDIRKSCLEAESRQIVTKALAIEKSARHYFPQMFGSFEVLNSSANLPSSLVKTYLQCKR